jgi:hypothetical protein
MCWPPHSAAAHRHNLMTEMAGRQRALAAGQAAFVLASGAEAAIHSAARHADPPVQWQVTVGAVA